MFGIVLSALNSTLAFVLRSVLIKFALFFGLFFVASEFMQLITTGGFGAPTGDSLNQALAGVPKSVWYFLNLFNFSVGIKMITAAIAARFLIRRIPFFG